MMIANICCVSGTVLNALYELAHLFLLATLCGRYYHVYLRRQLAQDVWLLSRVRIQTQATWLQTLHSQPLHDTISPHSPSPLLIPRTSQSALPVSETFYRVFNRQRVSMGWVGVGALESKLSQVQILAG